MVNLVQIKTALVSVSDKENIVEICTHLTDLGVKIISTGGTYTTLKNAGLKVQEVSDFTGEKEIMDGRVKTLQYKIHGGLLCDLSNKTHTQQMKDCNITKIDLLIVNLYPFFETVNKTENEEEIIENIDIGGPAMLRSASKNYKSTTVISSISHYESLMSELKQNNGSTTLEFRKKMAKLTFLETAYYDSIISSHLCSNEDIFTLQKLSIPLLLSQTLRYGENPHQMGSSFTIPLANGVMKSLIQIQGKELSYNNLNDTRSALSVVLEFATNSTCIVKHTNPCCISLGKTLEESYTKALKYGDSTSAFGGIVAFNDTIDAKLATKISEIFYEVIVCKGLTEEAQQILSKKKNLRILIYTAQEKTQGKTQENQKSKSIFNSKDITISDGFCLIQDKEESLLNNQNLNLNQQDDADEIIFCSSILKFFKSNAICITYDKSFVSGGFGQTSRIDAVKIACQKADYTAKKLNVDMSKVFLASDAFFPFSDNIEVISGYNIKNVIAPLGSLRDGEVLDAVKKSNIKFTTLPFRFFKH